MPVHTPTPTLPWHRDWWSPPEAPGKLPFQEQTLSLLLLKMESGMPRDLIKATHKSPGPTC